MLKCGTARAVITPGSPVRMAGYADRTGPYEGKYEDIWLRALHLSDTESGRRAVIVSADLIWFNPEMMELLEERLGTIGYSRDEVVFTATHNHSGPGNGNAFIPPLENGERAYMERLAGIAAETIAAAGQGAVPVTARYGTAEAPLNVDRRVAKDGGIAMLPNYGVEADHLMTVISFWKEDGSMAAAAVHYPCHANLAHENMLQRDYPGILVDRIEEEYPGSMAIFLQGATGDMRPNSVLGDRFVPASRGGVIAFGREAGEYAIEAIRSSSRRSGGIGRPASASGDIPVEHDFSAPLDDATRSLWMEWVEKKGCPDGERLTVRRFSICGIDMLFANCEIVRSYAAYARELSEGCILSGYSDGMIGYIPDDRQIREGGYEPVGSAPYFAIAGRFALGTEGKAKEVIKEALS